MCLAGILVAVNNGQLEPHPVWAFKNIKGNGVGGGRSGSSWELQLDTSIVLRTCLQLGCHFDPLILVFVLVLALVRPCACSQDGLRAFSLCFSFARGCPLIQFE